MPSSIHEHPEDWLATALADGLSSEERQALDTHLAGCEQCRALQADLVAVDEILRRDFPLAVGPAAGFENRLVVGFRCGHETGGRVARLRALVAWLLRQRGMQAVCVAATLLALVGLGQKLTGGADLHAHKERGAVFAVVDSLRPAAAPATASDAANLKTFDEPTGGLAFESAKNLPAKEVGDIQDQRYAFAEQSLAQRQVDKKEEGRSRLGYKDAQSPVDEAAADGVARRRLAGTDTYTGSTTVNAGKMKLEIEGADHSFSAQRGAAATLDQSRADAFRALPKLSLLNGRRVGDAASSGSAPAAAPLSVAAKPSADAEASISAPTPPPDPRKLIRNARAELEVASFDAAVDAITTAAAQDGGFLDTRNAARGANGKVNGTLVVKILPDNLDRFLLRLRSLGDLKNQTLRTEDVTKEYFDTDARMRNSRRMEERLLKMLEEVKGKMSEVLTVEKELGRVRSDIEQMQGELKLYDAQVRYATITLNIYEKDLHQPAAFLLRETATLALLAADVEKTATEARRIADAAHAQVIRSDVSRDPSGQSSATLRLLIAPDAANDVIAKVKTLARVANYNLQDERIAQNGGAPSDATGADAAKVERAPVTFDITVSHDEQISRQISFTLVAKDAEAAFEKARAAAAAIGAEIVNSNVAHTQDGHATATLGVRVPAASETALVDVLKTLGRAGDLQIRRTASGTGAAASDGPVLITLNLVDVEPVVQETVVRARTPDVEKRAAEIKREAAVARVDVEASDFASESDGRQHAELRFRLPMSAYPAFIERVRGLGEVKDFTVQRSDRRDATHGETESSAPAAVQLTLYSEGQIVTESSGLGATLRRTFGVGAGALMWSVQMIGVAVAFLAPWAVLAAIIIIGTVWLRRRVARRQAGKIGP